MEIAYQFRILSEISEHKLKNKITVLENANVVELDLINECDDDQSIGNDSPFDNRMDDNDAVEMYASKIVSRSIRCHRNFIPFVLSSWEETNIKVEAVDSEVVSHQCETCGITFDSLKLLKKHVRSHVIVPVTKRECKLCSKVFKSEALLRAHGKTHSDLRPYICEVMLSRLPFSLQTRTRL